MKLSDFINKWSAVKEKYGDIEIDLSAFSEYNNFDELYRGLTINLDDEITKEDHWENLLNILECCEW